MTHTQIIIICFSAFLVAVNIISSAVIMRNSSKFKKQQIVLKLFTSAIFTSVFVLFSCLIAFAAILFGGLTIDAMLISLAVISGAAHMVILQKSVCGITTQALFVNGKIMEWHTVYDFYIDKNRKIVIFSGNVKGGLTLKGLTKPLKYKAEDEEKLEKYLESHISKRFNKIVIR